METYRKQIEDQSLLNILTTQYKEVERAISNLLNAMEMGVVTSSTKERLEQLEEKKNTLYLKLQTERARDKLLITKEDIENYIRKAISREPRIMVDLLIKEVILYNDRIEIYYNHKQKTSPDGNDRRGFTFYTCKKTIIIDQHKLGRKPFNVTFTIELSF